jgi:hypothetical protein
MDGINKELVERLPNIKLKPQDTIMPFKYTLMCDTPPWIGYNVLENSEEILPAAVDGGWLKIIAKSK